jgi:tripartite-type tricarboxylate transporter receptor subunit TctC
MFGRRDLGLLVASSVLAAVLSSLPSAAQNWPTRPVTLVVPFAVGSGSDLLARVLGPRLAELLGQPVIVENISGAGGSTGASRVVQSPPKGYHVLLGSVDTLAIYQSLYKKPLYNSAVDFTPIGLVTEQPMVLIARKDLPASNFQEFATYLKANHTKMQYGSGGLGSGSHLTCARVNAAVGAEATHVPYRGSGKAMQDLYAGRIDYYCSLAAAAAGPIQTGNVKPIAILTKQRSPLFASIPTAHEGGLTDFDVNFWSGLAVSKNTPAPIIAKFNQAVIQTLDTPSVQERLPKLGISIVPPDRRSSAHMQAFTESEIKFWQGVIAQSGVSLD